MYKIRDNNLNLKAMKKLVLAISLVIASSVNVFSQDELVIWSDERCFLTTMGIEYKMHQFTDTTIIDTTYIRDKVATAGSVMSFSLFVDIFTDPKVKVTGYQKFDVSNKSTFIKNIEIIEYDIDENNDYYQLYIVFQDKNGKWYSSDDIIFKTY